MMTKYNKCGEKAYSETADFVNTSSEKGHVLNYNIFTMFYFVIL